MNQVYSDGQFNRMVIPRSAAFEEIAAVWSGTCVNECKEVSQVVQSCGHTCVAATFNNTTAEGRAYATPA
jgi:hypothetical protein